MNPSRSTTRIKNRYNEETGENIYYCRANDRSVRVGTNYERSGATEAWRTRRPQAMHVGTMQ